jgi:hypothetical protein
MSIKKLETEFVLNADKRGDNTFKQVKRNDFAAIYHRFDMEGKPLEFEVFAVKKAGGTTVFGRYYEPYEQYPGAAAFGRTAWSVNSIQRAQQIFEEITAGKGLRKQGQVTDKPVLVKLKKVKGVKGRPRVARPELVLPRKQFCMKELLAVNTGYTQPVLYIDLMKLVKQNKVVEAERKQLGRGRPVVFYKVKA